MSCCLPARTRCGECAATGTTSTHALQAENQKARAANGGDALAAQPSERALLSYLMARLHLLDPDLIVGHNIGNWDLSLLLQQCAALKVPQWSRVGRFKRNRVPNLTGGGGAYGGGASPVRVLIADCSACVERALAFARAGQYHLCSMNMCCAAWCNQLHGRGNDHLNEPTDSQRAVKLSNLALQGVMSCLAGRLLVDTYVCARDLLRETEYSLGSLARSLLQQERAELHSHQVRI